MFEATAALGGLDVKLVYYRGFSECKASRWLTTAADLHRAMRAVSCLGGETQIERVLAHAIAENQKQRVNALVFVGDAMEENVDRLCQLAGELGLKGVPIFLFHEGHNPAAARAFQQMAKLSRGAYLRFDLASADRLKDLLAAVAVYAAGGYRALADRKSTRLNSSHSQNSYAGLCLKKKNKSPLHGAANSLTIYECPCNPLPNLDYLRPLTQGHRNINCLNSSIMQSSYTQLCIDKNL